jgi:hypothetical protein
VHIDRLHVYNVEISNIYFMQNPVFDYDYSGALPMELAGHMSSPTRGGFIAEEVRKGT